MNEKDLKIIRYLAGVIFLALALSSFLYIYPFLFASASSAYTAYSSTSVIGDIVSAFGAAMMAVSIFLGVRQIFMVGAGFQAVSCLVKLLFSRMGTPAQDIVNIFSCILSLAGYVLIALRFLYKGIIINHNKKPSQPTLKRRFFKKKAAFFHGPVWERSGADFILKRKGEFF